MITPPPYKIVIAKYEEDISWLYYMNTNNVIIYDKSDDPVPGSIPRKNIGREAETFFNYIIENYYNLPDYVIFLQGQPFPHIEHPDISEKNLQENLDHLLLTNPPKEQAIPFFTRWYNYPKEPLAASYPPFKFPQYFRLLFNEDPPDMRYFAAGCQYIVPKDCITFRPIEFYKKLYGMIINNTIYDAHYAHNADYPYNPDEIHGWVLERLISYIFDRNVRGH